MTTAHRSIADDLEAANSAAASAIIELKKQFLLHFVRSGSQGRALKSCNVRPSQLKEWLTTDPDFRDNFELCRLDIIGSVEEVMWDKARKGDNTMIQFSLRAHAPETYARPDASRSTNILAVGAEAIIAALQNPNDHKDLPLLPEPKSTEATTIEPEPTRATGSN